MSCYSVLTAVNREKKSGERAAVGPSSISSAVNTPDAYLHTNSVASPSTKRTVSPAIGSRGGTQLILYLLFHSVCPTVLAITARITERSKIVSGPRDFILFYFFYRDDAAQTLPVRLYRSVNRVDVTVGTDVVTASGARAEWGALKVLEHSPRLYSSMVVCVIIAHDLLYV